MKKLIDQKATKERLKQLRIQSGYTQDEIAKMMGGSRSYYCSMESGDRDLNEKYLETLAKIYNVKMDEICIYVESEYDRLEKTMNILDSYRPANYYMVRHGNLEEDIIDLIKYFDDSRISEYDLLDPIFNNLGYDIKLINIKEYIKKWLSGANIMNIRGVKKRSKALLDYFGNKEVCILVAKRSNPSERYLISIDKYMELENYIYRSLLGNLEFLFDEYYDLYKSTAEEDLDDIINENMREENEEAFFSKLIHYREAKNHLLNINEYIGKLLDMEDKIIHSSGEDET